MKMKWKIKLKRKPDLESIAVSKSLHELLEEICYPSEDRATLTAQILKYDLNVVKEVVEFGKEIARYIWIAEEMLRAFPQILESYSEKGLMDYLPQVAELAKKIGKTDPYGVEAFFHASTQVLEIYSEKGWMDYLPRIIELGKELAKKNGGAAKVMFKTSPEILKYGFETLEEIVEFSKEMEWGAVGKDVFEVSPQILESYSEKGLLDYLPKVVEFCKKIAKKEDKQEDKLNNELAALEIFKVSPQILESYSKKGLLDYLPKVIELCEEIAKNWDEKAATVLFEASPEILKYGYDTLEKVIELAKEIGKKNWMVASSILEDSPGTLEIYFKRGLMDYLPKVIELAKEIAKKSERTSEIFFSVAPKILKYGYETFEKVVEFYKEIAEKDEGTARVMLRYSPEILEYGYKTLEKVVKLGKEIVEKDAWAALLTFSVSPEILEWFSYEKLEKVVEFYKKIAEKDRYVAHELLGASPKILIAGIKLEKISEIWFDIYNKIYGYHDFEQLNDVINSDCSIDKKLEIINTYFAFRDLKGILKEGFPKPTVEKDKWLSSVKLKLEELVSQEYGIEVNSLKSLEILELANIKGIEPSSKFDEKTLIKELLQLKCEGKKVEKNFPLGKIYAEIPISGVKKRENPITLVEYLIYGLISRKQENIEKANEYFDKEKLKDARNYVKGKKRPQDIYKELENERKLISRVKAKDINAARDVLNYFKKICEEARDGKAEPLSDLIAAIEGEFLNKRNYDGLVVKVQDGTIDDLFDNRTTYCCAFQPTGANKSAASRYLGDKNIGLLQIVPKKGNEYLKPFRPVGVAITCLATDGKEKYLLVDSVEGGSELDQIKWKEHYFNALVELAKDCDCKKIFFNSEAYSDKNKRFINYLKEKGLQEKEIYLKKLGGIDDIKKYNAKSHYLEAFEKAGIEGYVSGVELCVA